MNNIIETFFFSILILGFIVGVIFTLKNNSKLYKLLPNEKLLFEINEIEIVDKETLKMAYWIGNMKIYENYLLIEKSLFSKLELLKEKIEQLCFWDKITNGDLVPASERREKYIEEQRNFQSLFKYWDFKTAEEINLGYEFDTMEEQRTKRSFPTNSEVYHFHPIAFVEQMKMIVGSNGLQFDIYADGSITRIGKEESDTVSYIYHDENGKTHKLGTWNIIVASKYKNGKTTKPTSGDFVTKYSSAYGKNLHYEKIEGKTKLINIKKLDYKKNDLFIGYKFIGSREYIALKAFASLIGALAEVSYTDITVTGFTCEKGIGSPSSTHVNGIYGDLRYLNINKTGLKTLITASDFDKERQNKFADALNRFGYTEMVSHRFNNNTEEIHHANPEPNYKTLHKNHVHIQGYKPNLQILK